MIQLSLVLVAAASVAAQPVFLDQARPRTPDAAIMTSAAELVDLDRDGDLDLLLAGRFDSNEHGFGKARLWLNDGRGHYVDATAGRLDTTDWNSPALAVGDVDGDGDMDFFMSDSVFAVRLYLNDGTATFQDATARIQAPIVDARTLVLADFDGDGDLDLFAGRRPASLYLNDGSGAFAPGGSLPSLLEFHSSTAALDLERDGDLDLVSYTSLGVRIWVNGGAADFVDETASRAPLLLFTGPLVAGDFTGDGFDDVATVAGPLLVNDGSGVFIQRSLPSVDAVAIHAADVDSDGDLDLTTASGAAGRLLLNDGSGVFRDGTSALPAQLGTTTFGAVVGLLPGDVDGDGDLDLVHVGENRFGRVTVLLQSAGAWFSPDGAPLGRNDLADAESGDFDGDGDLDVVMVHGIEPVLLRNDGWGRLDSVELLSVGRQVTALSDVVAGDFDGDRDLDLFVIDGFSGGTVLRNDGGGGFSPAPAGTLPPINTFPSAGAAGDLDGDGDVDLVVVGSTSNFQTADVAIHRNLGDGRFEAVPLPVVKDCQAVTLGDIDADGDLDVILSRPWQGDLLWRNRGDGVFVDDTPALGGGSSYRSLLVDVDDDGDADLVQLEVAPVLRLNDGQGRFTPGGSLPANQIWRLRVAALDFDEDGDQDLVLGDTVTRRGFMPTLGLYENDGRGHFTDRSAWLPRDRAWVTALLPGDFDADGDADLYVGTFGQDRLLANLRRHVYAAAPPRPNETYTITIASQPAGVPQIGVPFLAERRGRVPLPPFGIFGLDPAAHFVLPAVNLFPSGFGEVAVPVPAGLGLTGRRIYLQAAIFEPTTGARLSNVFVDVVQ